MKKYGLIGKSLSHSWSPKWFAEKFTRQGIHDAEYRLYEMDSVENLRQWAVANNIEGFNVTIPFKEGVAGKKFMYEWVFAFPAYDKKGDA